MDSSMMTSTAYSEVGAAEESSEISDDDNIDTNLEVSIKEVLLEAPPLPCPELKYVVYLADSVGEGGDYAGS